jgi:hypothetical protein
MKNEVFWGVASFGSCKSRRSGGTCRPYLQGRRNKASEEVLHGR